MSRFAPLAALALLLASASAPASPPQTVCTITVNSPDEREALRRHLPAGDYRFVELVERGRADWLASACRTDVRCDVLVVSGHFDGGEEFYSDRLDARESLPVDELERIACGNGCPTLFSRLREVYLFGCNTLNGEPRATSSPEIERALVRAGSSPDEAARRVRDALASVPQSNRDRMRQLFPGVPTIYGFSSKAPLGRYAGPLLERYLANGGAAEIGSGRASPRLLALFSPSSMIATSGARAHEPQSASFAAACRLRDPATDGARKLAFLHALLRADAGEWRPMLERIERLVADLGEPSTRPADVERALAEIAHDESARQRFLALARDADEPAMRARMVALAHRLGWLSDTGRRAEIADLVAARLASPDIGVADVELACTLNEPAALPPASPAGKDGAAQAAVRACLGDRDARDALLAAFAAGSERDVALAAVYLRHRPLESEDEFRVLAASAARIGSAAGQARALETLARRPLADAEGFAQLVRLFPHAKSLEAQRAIAGILIRSDYRAAGRELARTLREHRRRSPDGPDVIDALIRRASAES